jgi:hypothetical protein
MHLAANHEDLEEMKKEEEEYKRLGKVASPTWAARSFRFASKIAPISAATGIL